MVPRLEEEIIIENVPKGLGKLNEIIEGKGLGKGPEPTLGIPGAVIPNVWFHFVTSPNSPY